MLSRSRTYILILLAALLVPSLHCHAQFKRDAFSQSFNDDTAEQADSTDKIFSIKDYWRGLTHKQETDLFTMFEGSTLLLGGLQIYNKDYWKLPLVYGGIAAGIGGGLYFKKQGDPNYKYWLYGAGLAYWGTLMDGVISYKPDDYPSPAKATFYSMLVPGLGQIYNHEVWKLPVYWGIMLGGLNYHLMFKRNYERFRAIYNSEDSSQYSLETSKYYKNIYRRYRDYGTLVIALGYVLQIIDANVFAYMHNFEVTEDLAIDVCPTIICPGDSYAFSPGGSMNPAFGMSVGIRF